MTKEIFTTIEMINGINHIFKEELPKGARAVKNPSDVPKGWSIVKGARGGLYAVPPVKNTQGSVPGNTQTQDKIISMINDGYSQDDIKAETGYEISDKEYNKIANQPQQKEKPETQFKKEPKDEPKNPFKWSVTDYGFEPFDKDVEVTIKKRLDEFNKLNKSNVKYKSGEFDDTGKFFHFDVDLNDVDKKKFAKYNGFENN